MGNTSSTTESSNTKEDKAFEKVLLMAARLVNIPVCADIIEYIESLQPILENIKGETVHRPLIEVKREDIFKDAMEHYRNKFKSKEKFHAKPTIVFKKGNNTEDVGEGPRREFYSEFFKTCLGDKKMFVGTGRRLAPSNDVSKGDNFQFAALGVAIVEAILNGDCGFPYLSETLYHFITDDKSYEKYLCIEDVPDGDIRELIKKIEEVQSSDELCEAINDPEGGPIIDQIGWPAEQPFTMAKRNDLVRLLMRWSIIDKRHVVIQQFKDGLNYMGFLESVKLHRPVKSLFVYSKEYSVSSQYLQKCFKASLRELKTEGDAQTKAKQFMETLLGEIKDNEAADIFVFVTGTLDPPIEVQELEIAFQSMDPETSNLYMPTAHTCTKRLDLPLGNDTYAKFKVNVLEACKKYKKGFMYS